MAHTFLRRGDSWKLCLGFLLVAFVYLWHLDTPVMWGDEAGTAVFGRNIIERGVPVGFDGRNLAVFGNCASVSQTLLSKKIPWVQYYIGALSISLFGETTTGARLLFVLIGLCSFFPLYGVLKKQSNYAALATTLVLLSPQVVLFQRNARYYPILIFLFFVLLWTYVHDFKSQKIRLIICCVLSFLFFHTHQLAAFCAMLSLVIFGLVKDRRALKVYLPAFLLGFGSWIMFYFYLKSVPGDTPGNLELLFSHPTQWFYIFLTGIKASILDFDYINAFPLLAWGLLLGFTLSRKNRRHLLEPLGSPVVLLILINLGIQVALNSGLVGFETLDQYSLLRYMPHLIAASLIPLFLMVEKLLSHMVKQPPAKVCFIPFVLIMVVSLNAFTFSYWFSSVVGHIPTFSWWPPVYAEIIEQKPDPFKTLIETLKEDHERNQQTILAWPPYVNEILNFYVGDKYLIMPNVLPNSACERAIIQKIGLRNYRRFKQRPKWIVFFFNPLKSTPPGYELIKIPFFRHSPDATRPELTRHDFHTAQKGQSGQIYVYKRL